MLPENTLPGFARALDIGVTTLELDCGITRDGVVVVSHDAVLNPDITRDPHGRWLDRAGPAIRNLTYDELCRYDVGRIRPGCAYARAFPKQQALDGTRIPALSALFELVRQSGNQSVGFNIETKISPERPEETAAPAAFARAVLDVVERARMTHRVSIQSFDWRTLDVVQNEAPHVPTVYLTAQSTSAHAAGPDSKALHRSAASGPPMDERAEDQSARSVPRRVATAGGRAWSPCHLDLTRDLLHEAHSLGLKVIAWTVNEEADMRRLIDWGIDGIISDYPDVLKHVAGA